MAAEEGEVSPGGSRIRRYEPVAGEPEISGGDPELIEAVAHHLERHVGNTGDVFHELISSAVHVDVFKSAPTDALPFHTLVTCGMAERPMPAPDDFPEGRFGELVLRLPPDWPLRQEDIEDERNYWPIRLLKQLARLPHEYDTWLWIGHTVPNGDPPEAYAPDTGLCGAILLPPVLGPDGFETLTAGKRQVTLMGVVPLHEDEMNLKLEKGSDELIDLLDAAELSELLDPQRPSVVPRRRRWFGRR
jgi:Suppressor of fused protein (SUFU)